MRAVPRFVSPDNYAASFGYQWQRFRDTQLDARNGLGRSATRFWAETRWNHDLTGETLLEAGSGAGRFTEVLAETHARVFTFDYSTAVDANHDSHGDARSVEFSQANIFELPFADGTFDRVVCLGVLQHTPSPRDALRALIRALRPGGELVADCYPINLLTVFRGKYLLRLATAGADPATLFPQVNRYFDFWYNALGRLQSMFGDKALYLSDLVGVCDYRHEYPDLPAEVLREFALLDTFDMLAPRYDKPQRRATLRRWLTDEGLTDVAVDPGYNGYELRGRKPR